MEHNDNAAQGTKAMIKNLLSPKVPVEYGAAYNEFCNGQNAQRLPYFYMAMAVHRISSVIVYIVLYPALFAAQTSASVSTYILYSVFYFIFLGLASYATKKFRGNLESHPQVLTYSYFMGCAILLVDDFVTKHFFLGIFNPILFLGGALLIAALPVFGKRITSIMIISHLVVNVLSKIAFSQWPIEIHVISSAYSVFLSAIVMVVALVLKTNHLDHFLEDQASAERKETLMHLSTTDALTKVSNRRAFDEYMVKVWEEAREKSQPVSVLMMDVDRFKLFNDNFGHIEGDKCLVKIARAVSTKFQRRGDMFARYGGEEFVAVIANQPGDDVFKFAEGIRLCVEDLKIANPLNKQNPYITMSIGLASRIPTEGESPYYVVELADAALYAAKQAGRNRVVTDFMEIEEINPDKGREEQKEQKEQKEHESASLPDQETAAIKKDLALLCAVAQANMMGYFIMDLNSGRIELDANSARRLGFGLYLDFDPEGNKVAVPYTDFIEHAHPEDAENLYNALRDAMSKSRPMLTPAVFRLSPAWDWVSLKMIYPENTQEHIFPENTVLGIISDFSEQMREREKNILIVEGASTYTFSYNFETDTMTLNENFCKDFALYDTNIENATEWLLERIPKKSDRNALLATMRSVENAKTDRIEFKLHVFEDQSKTMHWLLIKGKCIKNEDGKPVVMAGTLEDITQQQRKEEVNNLIIEGGSDCIFIFDVERDIFEFSSKIYDLVPTKTRTMKNGLETWLQHIIPVDRHAFTSALEAVLYGETEIFKVEFRLKGKNATPIWVALSGKCNFDEGGAPILIAGSLINMDGMRQFSNYLDDIRNVDKISGLPNRISFNQDFSAATEVIMEVSAMGLDNGDVRGGIIMVDIDDFGNINSLHGLAVGDRLLTEYGALLTLLIPPENKLYHFEGNRFVIYMQAETKENMQMLCDQINMYSSTGLLVDITHVKMTVSIGAAEFDPRDTVDDVVTNAELALRKAKLVKNSVVFFSPKDKEEYFARLRLENEIRDCVLDNFKGFEIFYQPLFSASLNMFIGGEALLRWRGMDGKIMSPNVIIPVLQSIGMFAEVEDWVFRNAAKQCAQWIELTGFKELIININMSPNRAAKGGLAEETLAVIEAEGLSTENIFLELTEESVVAESQTRSNALTELRDKGIRLAIDDFGTGYSSLGYLRDLPVCELKIDRSFVADIEINESNREFVAAIIKLCHIMDYIVCVEGVESLEQARILMDLNADILQGFYFSPPVPKDVMEEKFIKGLLSPDKFVQTYYELRGGQLREAEAKALGR